MLSLIVPLTEKFDLPASAATLSLFLHWKYGIEKRGCVDGEAMLEECKRFKGTIISEDLCAAVWLIGFVGKLQNFAENYYASLSTHPFCEKESHLEKLKLEVDDSPKQEPPNGKKTMG